MSEPYTLTMRFSSLSRRLTIDLASRDHGVPAHDEIDEGETPRARTQASSDSCWLDPWEVHERAVERREQGDPIILLSIGQEMNEHTPRRVVDAAIHSLEAGRHHYTDVSGERRLRESIARYHQRLTGQAVSALQCTVFAGAQNALFATAQLLLEAGDEAVLVSPFYTTYAATFAASGADIVLVELDSSRHYRLSVEALLDAIGPKTRVIVLNTPNNPLGDTYASLDWSRLMAACRAHDITVILDTVYLDIVSAASITLPHALRDAADHLVTIGSLSKSHRMTGWRVGWSVGPPELADHLGRLCLCMHYGLQPFVQDAACVAIDECLDLPRTISASMDTRRALARHYLDALPAVRLLAGGAGMFVLLDVSALGRPAREIALELLEKTDVAVLPCDGFGPGGEALLRIGLCVDTRQLESAFERLRDYFNRDKAGAAKPNRR